MIWGSRFVELGQRLSRYVMFHKQPAAAASQLQSNRTGAALCLLLMYFANTSVRWLVKWCYSSWERVQQAISLWSAWSDFEGGLILMASLAFNLTKHSKTVAMVLFSFVNHWSVFPFHPKCYLILFGEEVGGPHHALLEPGLRGRSWLFIHLFILSIYYLVFSKLNC